MVPSPVVLSNFGHDKRALSGQSLGRGDLYISIHLPADEFLGVSYSSLCIWSSGYWRSLIAE